MAYMAIFFPNYIKHNLTLLATSNDRGKMIYLSFIILNILNIIYISIQFNIYMIANSV